MKALIQPKRDAEVVRVQMSGGPRCLLLELYSFLQISILDHIHRNITAKCILPSLVYNNFVQYNII